LPETVTKQEVEQLRTQMGVLRELIADVWYTLRKTSPFQDGVPDERLTRFAYDLVQTREFGRAVVDAEAARIQEGHRLFREAWRAAEAKLHPTLEVSDGRLLDEDGCDLAYFNFKAPIRTDDQYRQIVAMMHLAFPEYVGRDLGRN
jgi:hypothetical protein